MVIHISYIKKNKPIGDNPRENVCVCKVNDKAQEMRSFLLQTVGKCFIHGSTLILFYSL